MSAIRHSTGNVAAILNLFLFVLGLVMTIADSYRAMSSDIKRAAEKVDHEDVRRAYLVLAELWSRAAMRADGSIVSVDESILEAIK
jgi:hypothetical protein